MTDVQTQPFTPDDVYCVYCHAPAAGLCAVCHALCCGACVELRTGLTQTRAVCRDCLRKGHLPAGAGTARWIAAALAASVLVYAVVFVAIWSG